MDLHLIAGAHATSEEESAVDSVVGSSNQRRRDLLLPALQSVQEKVGWISPGALNHVCRRLDVPPAEAYGVASFYALLSTDLRPARVAHVCDDIACRMNGAKELCAALDRKFGHGQIERSPCLGQCERGPAALFQFAGRGMTELAPATLQDISEALTSGKPRTIGAPAVPQKTGLKLLRRIGKVNPESLDDYRAAGGYLALRKAIELGPEGVIREINDSKLVGRGGAAFPAGRKWDAVARAPERPHYVVCNADESEPGTFKDRVLMEGDPFATLEAMTIAGHATASERGFIYIRGEYPLAAARLTQAIEKARARGFLGESVMGAGFRFDIEVRRGAGAYICGEETALFNSIEGWRGEPRNKPPYPTQHGLFGKPTLVNNVETLANVPDIMLEGGPAFAGIGTAQSTGPKLFCLSGCVAQPGVYEVTFGTTLRQLIELAGGVRGGRRLRAVLLGGAAGTFVTPEELDVPLTFEGTRAIGASLGSGVVMLFDDQVDMTDIVLRIAAFFRDESCGQCVPCRVGTERQEELLRRLAAGKPLGNLSDEVALLGDIGKAMGDASICGLGHTAALAAQSAIRKLKLFGVAK